jgi:hypothetical protein
MSAYIVLDNQIVPSERVCSGCLLADRFGKPRESNGMVGCARRVPLDPREPATSECYECCMGFRLVFVESI